MNSIDNERKVVVYACAPNYWEHTYVSLYSLLLHNRDIRLDVRVMAVAQNEQFFERAEALRQVHGDIEISWLPVDRNLLARTPSSYYTDACYFRLLLGRLLPREIHRVLYLDGDTIVRGSLGGLFDADVTDYVVAAVPEHSLRPTPWAPYNSPIRIGLPEAAPYLNSGVLMMNLALWRELDIEGKCFEYIRLNDSAPERLAFPDQDTLNKVLVGKWKELDSAFNFSEWTVAPSEFVIYRNSQNVSTTAPLIAHFAGKRKPWDLGCPHPFADEYWKYRMQTPYADWLLWLRNYPTRRAIHLLRQVRGRVGRNSTGNVIGPKSDV
jgi:lipopolysaccharide biosynthesis glycosyltransferase